MEKVFLKFQNIFVCRKKIIKVDVQAFFEILTKIGEFLKKNCFSTTSNKVLL